MHNKAFTLSEVLITLGIIGIVAAITLSALTAKYKKLLRQLNSKSHIQPFYKHSQWLKKITVIFRIGNL